MWHPLWFTKSGCSVESNPHFFRAPSKLEHIHQSKTLFFAEEAVFASFSWTLNIYFCWIFQNPIRRVDRVKQWRHLVSDKKSERREIFTEIGRHWTEFAPRCLGRNKRPVPRSSWPVKVAALIKKCPLTQFGQKNRVSRLTEALRTIASVVSTAMPELGDVSSFELHVEKTLVALNSQLSLELESNRGQPL